MRVPVGFLPNLWSFISFLPFFILLLAVGILKAAIVGPLATACLLAGNSSVIIGLWPAHFFWTYFCVLKTRRLGLVLKTLVVLILPLPMVALPMIGTVGAFCLVWVMDTSLLCLQPLRLLERKSWTSFITALHNVHFVMPGNTNDWEEWNEEVSRILVKLMLFQIMIVHKCQDGCRSTLEGVCTMVSYFTDFCFHSYFSYMDELSEKVPEGENPYNIDLSKLPGCLLVCTLALIVDVPVLTILALYKSPCMLLKGWKRLLEDPIGREGPFLETVCVPFAGLAIVLWPIAVVGAVICAFLSSYVLGFYSAVIVYQEHSLQMGFAYIISVISMFDEYTNDLLYLREGSCFPRPKYRKNERSHHVDQDKVERRETNSGSTHANLVSERSKTLKMPFQQLKSIQLWDSLFRSCEMNGRILLRDGLIGTLDIADFVLKGQSRKLTIKLPAWCMLQCLLRSGKLDYHGLLFFDNIELTNSSWPKDKLSECFVGPLMIMKEQIRRLQLNQDEEACLKKLIMIYDTEKSEDWNDSGFAMHDNVRIAQLQANLRRLQGIVASLSRLPTFRRRLQNLVKVLYSGKPGYITKWKAPGAHRKIWTEMEL